MSRWHDGIVEQETSLFVVSRFSGGAVKKRLLHILMLAGVERGSKSRGLGEGEKLN